MQAMDDNFDSGAFDHLPHNRYSSSLVIGTDIVFNEGTPFWSRVILDPDLPINDLLEIDFFSPASWLNFTVGLMFPHYTEPFRLVRSMEDETMVTAPGGLSHIIQGLDTIGVLNAGWETPEGLPDLKPFAWLGEMNGDHPMTSYHIRQLFNQFLPPAPEYLGPLSPEPKRRQEFGLPVDEGASPGQIARAYALRLGRGIGIQTESPETLYGTSVASDRSYRQFVQRLRQQGILTPEMEEVIDKQLRLYQPEEPEHVTASKQRMVEQGILPREPLQVPGLPPAVVEQILAQLLEE